MDKQLIKTEAKRLATGFIGDGYLPQSLHHYTDVNGEILYSRMRLYHPERKEKLIRPFCNTGTGFKFGEPKFSGKKPLYNLPLIKDAQTIFWVEGEQKADRLCELGIVATTSGGATSHEGADFEPLRGKLTVIWADNDEAGATHAKAVKAILEGLDCKVEEIDVDRLGVPIKGDVVDWLALYPLAGKVEVEALPLIPREEKPYHGVILLKASQLTPQPINWLWQGWVACGKIHLLGGIAGTGKTTISLALAASITTGGRFPDGSKAPSGNVVIWTGEDDITDTLTPRLMAMGADLDKVHFIQGVMGADGERPFNPSSDMPILQFALTNVGNVKLLIIDPIVSVVNGDSHKNAEVRKDLAPLVQMSEAMDFAIIGITHFSKGTSGREPIERITGSIAFGAVARVVLVASKGKSENGEDIRIFLRAKSNIGPDEGGFEYSVENAFTDSGIETSRILWGSALEGTARELLVDAEDDPDGGSLSDCMRLISDLLKLSEVSANEMAKDCMGAGYSRSTMNRAKKKLGVEAKKVGMGSGSHWVWELPKELNEYKDTHIKSLRTFEGSDNLRDNSTIVEGEI